MVVKLFYLHKISISHNFCVCVCPSASLTLFFCPVMLVERSNLLIIYEPFPLWDMLIVHKGIGVQSKWNQRRRQNDSWRLRTFQRRPKPNTISGKDWKHSLCCSCHLQFSVAYNIVDTFTFFSFIWVRNAKYKGACHPPRFTAYNITWHNL